MTLRILINRTFAMPCDLSLVVITPRMHRGHLIALLRHAPISGFHECTPEIAQMNQRMVEEAEMSFSPIDEFPSGAMRGQRIRSVNAQLQAIGLSERYPLANAEIRSTVLADRPQPFLPFVPFLLDAHAINGLTEYVRQSVCGGYHERIPAIASADSFFVRHYGRLAYLCED